MRPTMSFGRNLLTGLAEHIQTVKTPAMQAVRQQVRSFHATQAVKEGGVDLLEKFNKAYTQRKLPNFYVEGGVGRAAAALNKAENHKLMIVTGFNVDVKEDGTPLPETDGPPGAAMLAISAARLGKIVTMVTDEANQPVLKASLDAIDKSTAARIKILTFKSPSGAEAEAEAKAEAKKLLDTEKPNAVFSIEVPGRNKEGKKPNMRGKDGSPYNVALDQITLAANRRKGIVTLGAYDGGNEVGPGRTKGVPQKALDGSPFASTVAVNIPVTSFTSNNAAIAVGATMMANAGELDQLIPGDKYGEAIKAALAAGAVDGVTRQGTPNAPSADGKNLTGVDGFSVEANVRFADIYNNLVKKDGVPAAYAEKVQQGPFVVAMFDSSMGGAIATFNVNKMIKELKGAFPNVRLVPILDSGNAPYGSKNRGELIKLVADGLSPADQLKFHAKVMVCNTACLAFKQDEADTEGIDISKFDVPTLDLIANTANDIAANGGKKPVILSTQATAESDVYMNRVNAAADDMGLDRQEIVRIGAGDREKEPGIDWASLINKAMHKSKDPKDQEFLKGEVNKYVDKVPADATSVYLCCTHYPAVKELIEQRLNELGRGHIPVIDPMKVQVVALKALLENDTSDRSHILPETSPVVLTTGTPADVEGPVNKLLGNFPIVYTRFGQGFQMDLVKPLLFKEKKDETAEGKLVGRVRANSPTNSAGSVD